MSGLTAGGWALCLAAADVLARTLYGEARGEPVRGKEAVAAFLRDNHLTAVTLETNGIGRFLPGLLRRALGTAGVEAAVIEASNHRAKDLRILDAFDAVLAAGRLHVHESIWRTPFVREIREWAPGSACRDDGLDAVAGCLLSEPVRLGRGVPPSGDVPRRKPNWRSGGTFTAKTDFIL